jgi:hypothetical protein
MPTQIYVSKADVSLFKVAAVQWGDASAWLVLANANGMTDPMLANDIPIKITVPDWDPSYSGGAPQQ